MTVVNAFFQNYQQSKVRFSKYSALYGKAMGQAPAVPLSQNY